MKSLDSGIEDLADLKLVFSVGRDVDIANEYWSYKKSDKQGSEFEVLRDEIASRSGGVEYVEAWTKKYKMSNTDERDLNFYKTLIRRGYGSEDAIMGAKLSTLKGFVDNVYGLKTLWEGSMEFKDKDGKTKKVGYGNTIDKVNPELIFRFCKNKLLNGIAVYERINTDFSGNLK